MSNNHYLDLLPETVEYSIPKFLTHYYGCSEYKESGTDSIWTTRKYTYKLDITKFTNKEGKQFYCLGYYCPNVFDAEFAIPHIPDEEILSLKGTYYDSEEDVNIFIPLKVSNLAIDEDIEEAAKKLYNWLKKKKIIIDE